VGIRRDRAKGEIKKMGKPYVQQVEVIGLVEKLGRVILLDDFEDLFKWSGSGTGTDYTVEKDTTVAYNNSASLHLKTKATTPTIGDYVQAWRRTHVRGGKKISYMCYFRIGVNVDYLLFSADLFDGTNRYRCRVKYDLTNKKWQYLDSTGAFVDVPGGVQKLRNDVDVWYYFKLTVDYEKGEYVSLQCNDLIIDLTGIKLEKTPNPVGHTLFVTVFVYTAANAQAEAWYDDYFVIEE